MMGSRQDSGGDNAGLGLGGSVSSLTSRFEQMATGGSSSNSNAYKSTVASTANNPLPPARPAKPPRLRTLTPTRDTFGEPARSPGFSNPMYLAGSRANDALQAALVSRTNGDNDEEDNAPTPTALSAPISLVQRIAGETTAQEATLAPPVVPFATRPGRIASPILASSPNIVQTVPSPTLSASSYTSSTSSITCSSAGTSTSRKRSPPPVPAPRGSRSPSPLPSPSFQETPSSVPVLGSQEEFSTFANLAARFGKTTSRPVTPAGPSSNITLNAHTPTMYPSNSLAYRPPASTNGSSTSGVSSVGTFSSDAPRLPARPHSQSVSSIASSSSSTLNQASPARDQCNPFEPATPPVMPPALPSRPLTPNKPAASPPTILKPRPVPATPPRSASIPSQSSLDVSNWSSAVSLASVPPLPARKQSEPLGVPTVATTAEAFPPPTSASASSRPPMHLPARPRAATASTANSNLPANLHTRRAGENLPGSKSETTTALLDRRHGEAYLPPPPPIRAIPAGDAPTRRNSPPPRNGHAAGTALDDSESEEENVEDETVDAGAAGRRVQTEMPDATFANRRPPRISPERKVISKHAFNASAIYGRYVVTGSNHIRVWDSWSGENIGTILLPKDEKITVVEFIYPLGDSTAAAPYVGSLAWVGTKEGGLHVIDIEQMYLAESKPGAHGHPITAIFRCPAGTVATTDESGKTFIWTPSGNSAIPLLSSLPRIQRMSERSTFLWATGSQLWSAQGPHRHHGGTAARSPSLRIYDVSSESAFNLTPRPIYLPETAGPAGAILAGTGIRSQPNLVYLAHESGHVSIWEKDTFACISCLRISNYAITSLEGVLDTLWAGNREGIIHVYNPESTPWQVVKAWKASDEAVTKISVDVGSISQLHSLHVASSGREMINFWDGLLKLDWLEQHMVTRETEFSTYRNIKILMLSWNIDSCKPADLQGDAVNMQFLTDALQSSIDQTVAGNDGEPPEIIAVGFQEVVDLENRKITAKSMLLGKKKTDAMFQDQVSHQYMRWHDRLVQAVRTAMPASAPYTVVHAENMVGLFSCIFVRNSEKPNMTDIAGMTVKTGMKGRYGNKGAICARFVLDDSSICFLNCHLAAGQRAKRQRNKDLIDILEAKSAFLQPSSAVPGVYINGPGQTVFEHEICFLSGDLNYRIDLTRSIVSSNIRSGNLGLLREHDQLLKEMKYNQSFRLRSFREAELCFPPTYKFDPGTDNYDSSAKERIPAWCDRILYRTAGESNAVIDGKAKGKVESLNYRSWQANPSDHKPITGLFQVRIKKMTHGKRQLIWEEAERSWKARESGLLDDARRCYD